MKVKSIVFMLAWKYLGAQRKNFFVSLISLFSMLGVLIGTTAMVLVLSAANGFEQEVTQQMIKKDAHLEVLQYHEEPIMAPDSIETEILKNPDVIKVSPFIVSKLGISSRKVNDGIVVFGVDEEKSKGVIGLSENVKYGEFELDSTWDENQKRLPGVILGSYLANHLKVIIGEKIILQTFQSTDGWGGGSMIPKMAQYKVTGIFESGNYEYDANLAYVSLNSLQKLLDMNQGVTGFQGVIKNPMDSRRVADELHEQLGYPFYSMDWKEKNQILLKWMAIEKLMFGAAICLIILVAAFNIISSLIMVVLEKTREIGILRSMGLSRLQVMKIFMMVGTLVGFIGSSLGCVLGLVICWTQLKWGWLQLPPDVYMIKEFPVVVQIVDVLAVFGVANVLCLLATILPSWKASSLDPVGAIRHE